MISTVSVTHKVLRGKRLHCARRHCSHTADLAELDTANPDNRVA
jgi:hypothetical protein